ncbi:hypothetical protein BJY00DRAFT_306850 [Aspergillus carlsbadensis]|nr:hypothetical protein BJY00DRAFT_306850 [Aspergillus carlsbadensis]
MNRVRRQTRLREVQGNIVDPLGLALYDAFDLQLLDSLCEKGASFSRRCKTCLLLLACNRDRISSNAIRGHHLNGADPNQVICSDIDRSADEAFCENGVDLDEMSPWHASWSSGTLDLDAAWATRPWCPEINILLLANARYAAEAVLGVSLQPMSVSELPAPYRKVLGFSLEPLLTPPIDVEAAGPSKSSRQSLRESPVSPSGHLRNAQSGLVNGGYTPRNIRLCPRIVQRYLRQMYSFRYH